MEHDGNRKATPPISEDERREIIDGVSRHIERLIAHALRCGMIEPADVPFARNALLDAFGLAAPANPVEDVPAGGDASAGGAAETDDAGQAGLPDHPARLLEPLLDAAVRLGVLPEDTTTHRDLFDARLMGLLMPRPSETNRMFFSLAREQGIRAATDWFYRLGINANYIRMDRIRRNGYWRHPTPYGELEITINLSKPEKSPREIALLRSSPPAGYPKCLLCPDNVGYAGRPDHPARQNLRMVPVVLQGETWYFQYSPYVYYNEHSIVLSAGHVPMCITAATLARLLDFVEQFPHYFIGSNADLPIVGGSILNHDHYQAGRHRFPMELAPIEAWFAIPGAPDVQAGIVKWPMSVMRLRSRNRRALLDVAGRVLEAWRGYADPESGVLPFTGDTPHNTITPIARLKEDGAYELDLVLRNNRTSEEHPDGIFHPHKELHHIKKENIGLIEVMGLAVLPGRLQGELAAIAGLLTGQTPYDERAIAAPDHPLAQHAEWIAELVAAHGTGMEPGEADAVLRRAVGDKFLTVLEHCGVFRDTAAGREAFRRFLGSCGFVPVG